MQGRERRKAGRGRFQITKSKLLMKADAKKSTKKHKEAKNKLTTLRQNRHESRQKTGKTSMKHWHEYLG